MCNLGWNIIGMRMNSSMIVDVYDTYYVIHAHANNISTEIAHFFRKDNLAINKVFCYFSDIAMM